jgi:hypothetical protein
MALASHHRAALVAALGLSAVALADAVSHGITGDGSVFSDEGQVPWIRSVGAVVHGLAYAGGVWALHAERRRLEANRMATAFRWLLVAALAALAAGFGLVAPFAPDGLPPAPDAVFAAVVGTAFGLQFVAATGLGLSLLRHPETGVGSRVLQAVLPVLALTALLAAVAPAWAHPAYLEATTIVGVALLGTAARPGSGPTPTPTVPGALGAAGRARTPSS